MHSPLKGQDAGAIVRAARLAAGLTLADLGRRCGYSASQVSRYERGIQPLTDIPLLRRFSQVLAVPPQVLGLTPPDGSRAGQHAVEPKDGDPRVGWPRVSREPQWDDGEDPVRRRELLAGAAELYHSTANAEPVPLAALRTAVTGIRGDFQSARYDRMAASLPALIATATASTLLADAYITAASFMVKRPGTGTLS